LQTKSTQNRIASGGFADIADLATRAANGRFSNFATAVKRGQRPFAARPMNAGFTDIEPNICFSNVHYIEVGSAEDEADPPIGNGIIDSWWVLPLKYRAAWTDC
jgi:hypothetical protein